MERVRLRGPFRQLVERAAPPRPETELASPPRVGQRAQLSSKTRRSLRFGARTDSVPFEPCGFDPRCLQRAQLFTLSLRAAQAERFVEEWPGIAVSTPRAESTQHGERL